MLELKESRIEIWLDRQNHNVFGAILQKCNYRKSSIACGKSISYKQQYSSKHLEECGGNWRWCHFKTNAALCYFHRYIILYGKRFLDNRGELYLPYYYLRTNVCEKSIIHEGYVMKVSSYVGYENYLTCCGLFCWKKCQKSRYVVSASFRLFFLFVYFYSSRWNLVLCSLVEKRTKVSSLVKRFQMDWRLNI